MATVVPPNPVFPQTPVVPVAGTHTTSIMADQLAQSVNRTIAQTTAYLAQTGTTTILVPGTDRSYGVIYQNLKPNPILVKIVGTGTGTQSGFMDSVDPPLKPGDEDSATGGSSSMSFVARPNDFYTANGGGLSLKYWNEIDM